MNITLPVWLDTLIVSFLAFCLMLIVILSICLLVVGLIALYYDMRNSYREFKRNLDDIRKNDKGGD